MTKRRTFEKCLITGITSIAAGGADGIVYYREKYFPYKVCTGREHEFYYNDMNFTDETDKSSYYFDMSPIHPFRVIFNFIVLFGGNIGIPLLYGLTYMFTKVAPGLSDEAMQRRRQKNLVSIRFNLMNWVLESVMILMIVMTTNKMFQTSFILVTSIGTPLIYYLGIEENRQKIKEFYRNQIKIRKVKDPAAKIPSDGSIFRKMNEEERFQ